MKVCPRCSERFDDATRFCPHDGAAVIAEVADPHIGQIIMGQFELLQAIGRGAMGTVYRAWQTGMERHVAVKVLHPQLMRDAEVVKRFSREARAVARLSHPNIVTMFVVGQTGEGTPCLVMEFVEGDSLDAVLGGRAMPAERSVRIVRQIASALAEAHAAGIVHRDLKPANVILAQRRRSADFVKILDFGIAKIIGRDSITHRDSDLTKEGAIFGTPFYLSPEQASGGAIDHRADIYSLGVILYQMLCGRLPFEGTGMAALLGHVNDPVPHPRDVAPGVDERVAAIALRCLEKDPARRYQSAEELADALDATAAAGTLTPWASGIRRRSIDVPAPAPAPVDPTGQAQTIVVSGGWRAIPSGSRPAAAAAAPIDDGEPNESAPLSLDGGDSLAIRRPRRRWLSGLALALAVFAVGVGSGIGVYVWRAPAAPTTPARTVRAPSPDAGAPASTPAGTAAPDAGPAGGRRTVIVSEGGYSFQAVLPERMVAGVRYEIELATWDPAGEPLTAPEVVVTIEEPGGIERGLAAKLTDTPGRYRFTRSFRVPGTHYLHVFPPSGNTNVKLWLEVVAP